jgi:hypothetical protein
MSYLNGLGAYIMIAAAFVVVIGFIWYRKRQQTTVDSAPEEAVAPYKIETPVVAQPVTPVVEPAVEVVAAKVAPELKVVSGNATSKPRAPRKPRARKPAAAKPAAATPATKTTKAKPTK